MEPDQLYTRLIYCPGDETRFAGRRCSRDSHGAYAHVTEIEGHFRRTGRRRDAWRRADCRRRSRLHRQSRRSVPGPFGSQGAAGINRTAKTDREPKVLGAAVEGRTVLLKVESLADTSVLVRIPVQKEARNLRPAPAPAPAAKPGDKAKKMTVACEPVVSVLTEVAKLLQPGKCVT
jgi:hypothetical protein